MKNKVLVELVVPELEKTFNVFLPINKKIGSIILLLNKSIVDISNNTYHSSNKTSLYNCTTGTKYDSNQLLIDTDIRNGTKLVFVKNKE